MPLQVYSKDEVAKHNTLGDLWIIVDNRVYDVSKFSKIHPGGATIFLNVAGANQDATTQFYSYHKTEILDKYHDKLCIGTIEGTESSPKIWKPAKEWAGKLDLKTATKEQLLQHPLLSKAPYGEASWLKPHYNSKYYTDSHLAYRLSVREFMFNLKDEAEACEENNEYVSQEVYQRMGRAGILASKIGVLAMPYAEKFGIELPAGVKPGNFDFFHELICHEEQGRLGVPGYGDGMHAGLSIGLPPIINFYRGKDKDEIIKSILMGDKRVCLAITGPEAGSDVANMQITAKKTEDGKHYIVRGLKKWITNGMFCDYFVTAARTGGKGVGGVSLLLIKREDGVVTKQISCSYAKSAGTALVIYDDVKVPVERIMGQENKGTIA